MKIVIINFPILDVGGISSWVENILKGFKCIDIYVDHYYATSQRRFSCEEDRKVPIGRHYVKGDKLPSKHTSYWTEERVEIFAKYINNTYDYCIFAHPSPHPIKSQLALPCANYWMGYYRHITIPKMVIFHDSKWERTNKWFAEVSDHIDICMADQRPHMYSMNSYPGNMPKVWTYFPLDFDQCNGEVKRKKIGMMATQWIKWKNHHKVLPHFKDFQFPMYVYGTGMEYHKLRVSGEVTENFGYNKIDPEFYTQGVKHKYFGFITYQKFVERFKRSILSLDASTRGYNNFTHFEPMMFGCISCTERNVMAFPLCMIPEDCTWVYDMDNLAEMLNVLYRSKNIRKEIAVNAWKWVQRFDCKRIAKELIRFFKGEFCEKDFIRS